MKVSSIFLGSCVLLAGCQSTEVIEQDAVHSKLVERNQMGLNAFAVKVPSEHKFAIKRNTQQFDIDGVTSPVTAVALPNSAGALDITVTSVIGKTAFAPYVAIIREDGTVVDGYQFDQFTYQKPRFHLGNRLTLNFVFMPLAMDSELTLVVYTKPEMIGNSVSVIHPARLDAEARGNHLPEVKDIDIPFALQGEIVIEIDTARHQLDIESADKRPHSVTEQSAEFYRQAIRDAVKDNELQKAVSLLEEAESLGISKAREVFNQAINDNSSNN